MEGAKSRLLRMIKDMDIDRSKLIAGQVAYDVDRTIAHYVLDTVVGQGHYINKIKQMQSAIDG